MGCVWYYSVIKWACLLAPSPSPPQALNNISCLIGTFFLNETVIKWTCLLAPSPPTFEAWYLVSNGLCFEHYCNQVGLSASTILPPPLKHDTSCLMGCLLNDTVIKWACLLAAPHPPLKHDTSCLPHSLPTHEDWYIWKKSSQFIAKNQSFWKHSNIMRFLLASLSDPVWSFNDCNIFGWHLTRILFFSTRRCF